MKDLYIKNNLYLKKPFKDGVFESIFLTVTAIASYYFYKLNFMLCDGGGGFEFLVKVVHNSGTKPFQYRILIPYIANILYQLSSPYFISLDRIFKILEVGSIFLLIISFRYYISLFIKDKIVHSLLSFLILFVLPFNIFFPRPYHPHFWYDTPSILFFTLGLILMYKQKWLQYYVIFIIATVNRETTCFLTFIYLCASLKREKPNKIIYHCVGQLIIWMIIKGALARLYINNPGPNGFEWYDRPSITHLSDNISFFMNLRNYPLFFSNMGFIWIPVLFYYRLIKIEFVKRSLLAVFPLFIGMMFVANIYELRIFEELIPVFLMAFMLILNELLKNTF